MQSLRQDERDVAGSVTCPARPEWLVPLRACAVAARSQVGGKAAGLGRMMAAGLPVPEGVCLTSAAFEGFRTGTPRGDGPRPGYRRPRAVLRTGGPFRSRGSPGRCGPGGLPQPCGALRGVVSEAMARGVPVLTSNNSGIARIIFTAGEHGWQCNVEDADDFGLTLVDALTSPSRPSRAAPTLNLVRDRYTWDRV